MCNDLGCSNEILKIITELVKTPEKTKQILHDINTYNYGGLVKNALQLIGENKTLQQYLQENGEAYKALVSAMFRQLDPMINMKEGYELDDKDINVLTGMIPHLLSDPAKLATFYNKMEKEKYLDMMIETNEWAKNNKGLKSYLKEHAQAIANTISKVISHTPADTYIKSYLGAIDLDIQSLVSATLQHDHLLGSNNLSTLLNGVKTDDLSTMLASIDQVIDDPNIKVVLDKALGKENTELILKLNKAINENQFLKNAVEQYSQDKDYYRLIGAFLGNSSFQELLQNERGNIGNFVKFLTEKVPVLRDLKVQYLGEVGIDELMTNIMTPNIIQGIATYLQSDGGKVATAAFIWAMSGLITKFPILQYFTRPTQTIELAMEVKNKVNIHAESNEVKNLTEVLKAGDSTPELKNAIEQKSLVGINLGNIGFNNINIDGFNFAQASFF